MGLRFLLPKCVFIWKAFAVAKCVKARKDSSFLTVIEFFSPFPLFVPPTWLTLFFCLFLCFLEGPNSLILLNYFRLKKKNPWMSKGLKWAIKVVIKREVNQNGNIGGSCFSCLTAFILFRRLPLRSKDYMQVSCWDGALWAVGISL